MRPGSATTGHAPQRRSLGRLTFPDSGLTWLFTAGRTGWHGPAAQGAGPPGLGTPLQAGTVGPAAAAPRTVRVPLVRVDTAGAWWGFGDAGDLAAQRVTPTAVGGDTGHHALTSSLIAAAACCGTTPLPSTRSAGLRGRWSVTQPGSSPISHSTKRGESRCRPLAPGSVGSGAGRPVTCSQRRMAGAYWPQRSGMTALGSIRSPDDPR